jgi:hypothetical protein
MPPLYSACKSREIASGVHKRDSRGHELLTEVVRVIIEVMSACKGCESGRIMLVLLRSRKKFDLLGCFDPVST